MKRALPWLAILGGCALRDARVTVASCASNAQCPSNDLCFLGECRPPSAANLSVVPVEVRPPSTGPGSQFGVRSLQVDLGSSVINDFTVALPLNLGDGGIPATVTQAQDDGGTAPVGNAAVTFSDHLHVIPDRIEQVVATTLSTGAFAAAVPQGTWDVVVQPPSPLPPMSFGVLDTAAPVATYLIPATSSLPQLDGGVTANGGTPLAGVSITAVDDGGVALSSAVVTQPDGTYSILLPPDAGTALLQIGPSASADGGASGSTILDPFPSYTREYAAALDLPLPAVATISGHVIDSLGSPVAAARVYVRSTSSSWTLSRSVVADAAGGYSVAVRNGDYLIQGVPAADATSPALSAVQPLTVATSMAGVDLVCPPKVRRKGTVLGPDGRPVGANFQVVATRLADALVTTRTIYATPTDTTGVYHVVADGGLWRFEVVPPASALLPDKIVQFDIDASDPGESQLAPIQISPALKVSGTVKGFAPGIPDAPVQNAQVRFFALDSSGHSVVLGSGVTDSLGRYDIILPDVEGTLGP